MEPKYHQDGNRSASFSLPSQFPHNKSSLKLSTKFSYNSNVEKCPRRGSNYYRRIGSKRPFWEIEESCNKELINLENYINNVKQLKCYYQQSGSQASNLDCDIRRKVSEFLHNIPDEFCVDQEGQRPHSSALLSND